MDLMKYSGLINPADMEGTQKYIAIAEALGKNLNHYNCVVWQLNKLKEHGLTRTAAEKWNPGIIIYLLALREHGLNGGPQC